MRLKGPLPLISMTMSLSCGLSIFWVAILLHHFIVLYHITLSHCVDRTCGIACLFFIILSDVVEERLSLSTVVGSLSYYSPLVPIYVTTVIDATSNML